MLILLLYFIPFFSCCLMGETIIWQLMGYFGKTLTQTRYFGYQRFRVLLFSGQFRVAFLDTRITRTPRASAERQWGRRGRGGGVERFRYEAGDAEAV